MNLSCIFNTTPLADSIRMIVHIFYATNLNFRPESSAIGVGGEKLERSDRAGQGYMQQTASPAQSSLGVLVEVDVKVA
ncbi:hypothetical protein J6590_081927 [Homalodisca vitripennis]|nr:hypothetical protein J6590_081927 [Homalodisca vitripennis]